MNVITLMGRLTREPELKCLPSGKVLAKITLAHDEGYGDKKTTSFTDVVLWGKTAKLCNESCKKGHRLIVSGSLIQRKWTDQEGSNHSKHEINAREMTFIEPKQQTETVQLDDNLVVNGNEGFGENR